MTALLGACELPHGKILAALSGGADSTALLLSLCDEAGAERVCALHVNHCLRGEESDRDERFCRELCDRLGVEIKTVRRDVNAERRRGETLEQAARRIRYDELISAAREFGCAAVATAHTANDCAETVLFNLARGSGGRGLGGIPAAREQDGVAVIRPMLGSTRADVERYLAARGQDYVTDSSNLGDDYSRNLLRHRAIPVLERTNPQAVRHIAAAAASAREDEEYLRGEAVWLVECARREDGYDAETLAAAAAPIRRRAIAEIYWQASEGRTLERVHIEAVERLLASDDPSARLSLPAGVVARRVYGGVLFGAVRPSDPPCETALELGTNEFGQYRVFAERVTAPAARALPFALENAIYLRADREYYLRTRREGDCLRPKGRGMTKSIKKLCVELKIPAADRDRLPVVFARGARDGEAAALTGYAPGEDFAAAAGTDALRVWAVKFEKTD